MEFFRQPTKRWRLSVGRILRNSFFTIVDAVFHLAHNVSIFFLPTQYAKCEI